MDLKTYLSTERGRQSALAKTIGAHTPDISRWAYGDRPIPVRYGAQIERATNGEVTRQEMFPNDWHLIWPELVPLDPMSTPTTATKDEAERDGGMRLPMHTERVK